MTIPQQFTIDLGSFRLPGASAMMIRMRRADKYSIDKAAHALGIRTADFTRMILLQAAEQVLSHVEPEPPREPVQQRVKKPKTKLDPNAAPGKRVVDVPSDVVE